MSIDFNAYKDNYLEEVQRSIAFIGKSADYFIKMKAQFLVNLAQRYLDDTSILNALDVGCGIGLTDSYVISSFGELHAIDIAEDLLRKAAQNNSSAHYHIYNGNVFPFPDNTFDLVFTIGVMHHIPPVDWENFVQEMYRVTKKGGIAIVFEHNPYNPLTRLAVKRCKFDADAVLLRKNTVKKLFNRRLLLLEQGYLFFFPFCNTMISCLENKLKWLPLGAQYYVAGKKM